MQVENPGHLLQDGPIIDGPITIARWLDGMAIARTRCKTRDATSVGRIPPRLTASTGNLRYSRHLPARLPWRRTQRLRTILPPCRP